jgi:hypothetical protein
MSVEPRHLRALPFRPITLADRPRLDPMIRSAGLPLCEYTFATQFCWSEFNRTEWSVLDDRWLLVRYVEDGHEKFLWPVGEGDASVALAWCDEYLRSRGHLPTIGFVPEVARGIAEAAGWRATPDPDEADYCYARADLVDLPGGHFSRKRNHIKRFGSAGPWTFGPVDPAAADECLEFLREWCRVNGCSGNSLLDYETQASMCCIRNLAALDLVAAALRVDGRIIGLTIGEVLRPGTFVVHYEKALLVRDGVYSVLANEFARMLPPDIAWIDREQDLGVEGLRKSKESWFPRYMEPAYVLTPS